MLETEEPLSLGTLSLDGSDEGGGGRGVSGHLVGDGGGMYGGGGSGDSLLEEEEESDISSAWGGGGGGRGERGAGLE